MLGIIAEKAATVMIAAFLCLVSAPITINSYLYNKSLCMVGVNDYSQDAECIYKEERYSVRDNGAVLRHPREGKRPRPTDNQWTFGKPNDKTGYMEIASVRVHRIVASAFHGEPPTKEHVVDHIDTNKRNNRPENLRWVTRLENVLLNPITAKRIAYVCGSVEAFLADPAKYRDQFSEPYEQWMQTVSAEEVEISLRRMLAWAENDKPSSGRGSLDKWIFTRNIQQEQPTIAIPDGPDYILSLTPGAAQRGWRTPSEFPNVPQDDVGGNPLAVYAEKLKEGTVFSQNQYRASLVIDRGFSEDRESLYVMTISSDEDAIKRYALGKVTYEDGLFIHAGHTYFTKEGAEKQLTLAQGLEWTGGDSIDDYC
ncbi:HNH endonuclease signature motif containing protein [Alistipes sp.]|uniref:HNH endonuclease signature motif containing protein n=1 Tax=Alistipes sp. TaxID=1872444 RepID=UPI003AB8ECFA